MSRKLYNYKQKNNLKTTLDIGEITPVYWNKLEPGERIKNLRFKNLSRMITPVLPTMDNPYVDLYAFAVPQRILIPNSNDKNPKNLSWYATTTSGIENSNFLSDFLFGINKNNNQKLAVSSYNALVKSKPEAMKYVPNPAVYNTQKTLMSCFGFAPKNENNRNVPWNVNSNSRVDLSYLFVYKKIYYDFFKHKQLEWGSYDDWIRIILENGSINLYKWPSADVSSAVNIYGLNSNWASNNNYFEKHSPVAYLNRVNIANIDNEVLDELQFENYELDNILKTSPSTLFNFNSFKRNIFDKFMQNDKILHKIDYGTQKDVLLKIWNTDNGDRTNAKLIGYERYNQTIKQVINQTKGTTLSQSLGEVGGMSMVYNEGQLINEFTATEPTFIMVVAVPNYKLTFNNVYPYNEWICHQNEFVQYNPELDFAQQEFQSISVLNDDNANTSLIDTLGYQRPFDWMRRKSDIIAGEINKYWDDWTYSIPLNIKGGLSLSQTKTQKAPFKNTLTSPTQDAFIQEWEFNVDLQRTIKPAYIIESELIKGE